MPFEGPLAVAIGKWAESFLEPYLRKFPRNRYTERKEIHDPVAGIVELQPWEVYVLDSPILQRLRYVRQLGVGHFLFPSSGYSRFEHSVGTVHTASRMFDAVCGTPISSNQSILPYKSEGLAARRDVVRLAAMLHDIGHCVFSHVSERFYGNSTDVKQTAEDIGSYYESAITPAEAVTLLILQTESFRKLLAASGIRRTEYNEETILQLTAACIAGSKKILGADTFLAEMVNGPVDCDKLDYLARDAHMAGVPVSLDIPRLLSKLRVAKVRADDGSDLWALAIVQSGTRALDELLVSRIFLYDKFYYHPKVMAAEELVRRALYHLAQDVPTLNSPAGLLPFGDDAFIGLTPPEIELRFGVPRTTRSVVKACELLARVRNRELPRRAFAFASRFLPEEPEALTRLARRGREDDAMIGKYEYRTFVRLLLQSPDTKERAAKLIGDFAAELGAKTEVFIGIQSATRAAGNVYLPVILPDGQVDEKPSFLFKTSEWTEAYALNKQTQYVFADGDLPKVHLAAERLFQGNDMSFAPNSMVVAKISRSDLNVLRAGMAGDWLPVRNEPDLLASASIQERIRVQQQRLSSFLHSVHPELGKTFVEAWLFQFPDGDLRESALQLIEHITYVEAPTLVGGFRTIIARNAALREALWIPFRGRGGVGKSADQLGYDLKDLKLATLQVAGLTVEALSKANRIVFFDDSLNSGTQARCLLSSWFDRSDLCAHPKDGDPAGPLAVDIQEALRRVPTEFVFYAAHPMGKEVLKAVCDELGLGLERINTVLDTSEPKYRLEGLTCASAESKLRLITFLQKKGEELLGDKIVNEPTVWTKEKTKQFALGYSGLELTVVFRHSISASTPVVLWRESFEKGLLWLPLFPRERLRVLTQLDPQFETAEKTPEE